MPHPYFTDVLDLFNGCTKQVVLNTANCKFFAALHNKLQQSVFFRSVSDDTLLKGASKIKINLTNDLTNPEIETLADAMCGSIIAVLEAYSAVLQHSSTNEMLAQSFDWQELSVKLN